MSLHISSFHTKSNLKMRTALVSLASMLLLMACKHEPFVDPNGGTTGGGTTPPAAAVCFETDVLPLFIASCARAGCHDATTRAEGYVLDSYANIVKKGLKAGSASASKLFTVLNASGTDRMPPPPNAALTADQKKLIENWINEGAKNTTNCATATCDTSNVTFSKSVLPIINNACLGCHNNSLASGGYNFSTYTGVKASVTAGRLMGSINYTPGFSGMPQGAKLSACHINTIRKWVDAGALNN